MNVIEFKRKPSFHRKVLTLGNDYVINNQVCRFIKVTPKGYNFLRLDTNKCILKSHLYDRRFYGKELPKNHKEVKTWLPDFLNVMSYKGIKNEIKV